jgi:glutathione S-transferase
MFEGAEPDPATLTKLEDIYQIFDKLLVGQTWAAGDHITIAYFALVATVSSAEVSMHSCCSIEHSTQLWSYHVWCKLVLNLVPVDFLKCG